MDLSDDVVRELLALAGVSLAHDDLPDALDEVCRVAARAVPCADGASLTTFSATGPHAAAASSEWSRGLDEMQYDEHEGPCLDAGRTGVLFRVRDIDRETRWPTYMPRASAAGARSMVSVPMTVEAKTIGALNVYSKEVDAFRSEDVSLAEVIAGHASLAAQVGMALQHHRDLAAQLRQAMASRATIEQAKGIVMATAGCGPDEAFERLTQQSSHENRKLREVAADLVRQQLR
ncbi:GAF and ANTAR domain-containing protein [Aquihabitans daechungensis]|uniref:GAF and ANTAR domain-containing protein n=1 Tax=Aquihabitans daechungensis TaxID=1052257 RepID=UPI003BA28151